MSRLRYEYHTQCDRFRQNEQGESDWQEMMRNARKIPMSQFEAVCNPEGILDEGETLDDFVSCSSDPDSDFYVSSIRDHRVLFYQSAGFEFIFTPGGQALPNSPGPNKNSADLSL